MNKNGFLTLCVTRIEEAEKIEDPILKHYAMAAAYYECKNAARNWEISEDNFQEFWNSSCNFVAIMEKFAQMEKEQNV